MTGGGSGIALVRGRSVGRGGYGGVGTFLSGDEAAGCAV